VRDCHRAEVKLGSIVLDPPCVTSHAPRGVRAILVDFGLSEAAEKRLGAHRVGNIDRQLRSVGDVGNHSLRDWDGRRARQLCNGTTGET